MEEDGEKRIANIFNFSNKSPYLHCVTLYQKAITLLDMVAGMVMSAAFCILYGSVPCGALMRPLLSDKV